MKLNFILAVIAQCFFFAQVSQAGMLCKGFTTAGKNIRVEIKNGSIDHFGTPAHPIVSVQIYDGQIKKYLLSNLLDTWDGHMSGYIRNFETGNHTGELQLTVHYENHYGQYRNVRVELGSTPEISASFAACQSIRPVSRR